MNLTEMENKVYESVKEECKREYSSGVIAISNDTGIGVNSVKGVVGSLVKKGLLEVQEEERCSMIFHDIFAIVDDELWSYAIENGYCEK